MVELWVAIVASVIGPIAVTSVKAWFDKTANKDAKAPGRRKGEGTKDPRTVSSIVLEWATQLSQDVERVTKRVTELEAEVSTLRRENAVLRRHAEILSGQVTDLGGKPWPFPNE